MDCKVVKFKYATDDCFHDVFIKEHVSRSYDDDKPLGRTLFVANISPYLNEEDIRKIFSTVDVVSSIVLHRGIPSNSNDKRENKLNGFQSAYIVYNSREGLLKCLSLTSIGPFVDSMDKSRLGLSKYAEEYNNSICNHEALYKKAVEVIQEYDRKQTEKKNVENEVDEEGWTLVTTKGRNPGVAFKESVEVKLHEKLKNKMKKKQLKNFYSFQVRESKMKHLTELREQHELAKKKIAEMKKTRTFKPF